MAHPRNPLVALIHTGRPLAGAGRHTALTEAGGHAPLTKERVVHLPGPVTGEVEGDELNGEDVAGHKGLAQLLIEGHHAGAHGVEDAGLGGQGLSTYQELDDHILPQVFRKELLHGAVHCGGVEVLGRRGGDRVASGVDGVEGGVLGRLGVKSCHRKNLQMLSVGVGVGGVIEAVVANADNKDAHP